MCVIGYHGNRKGWEWPTCSTRSPQLTATMLEGTVKLSDQWQGSVYESTQGNHRLKGSKEENGRGRRGVWRKKLNIVTDEKCNPMEKND